MSGTLNECAIMPITAEPGNQRTRHQRNQFRDKSSSQCAECSVDGRSRWKNTDSSPTLETTVPLESTEEAPMKILLTSFITYETALISTYVHFTPCATRDLSSSLPAEVHEQNRPKVSATTHEHERGQAAHSTAQRGTFELWPGVDDDDAELLLFVVRLLDDHLDHVRARVRHDHVAVVDLARAVLGDHLVRKLDPLANERVDARLKNLLALLSNKQQQQCGC